LVESILMIRLQLLMMMFAIYHNVALDVKKINGVVGVRVFHALKDLLDQHQQNL
jgi:hypothetical protein